MANNLTTLANVKAWANVSTTGDDALLTRLIGSVSRFILSYLERTTFFKHACADVFDGVGQRAQFLREYPVLSVSSVLSGSQVIPSSTGYPQCGYLVDTWNGYPPGQPQALSLLGYYFGSHMPGGISVNYIAGFAIQGEAWIVPATPFQVTVNAPNGPWGQDDGVIYANGAPLTLVTGTPAAGQYSVAAGVYTFAAADAGQSVLISYSYIPADIEQACCEMVAERYSYRGRIGQISKSLGGQETVSFSQKNMPDYIATLLNPYKSVILV